MTMSTNGSVGTGGFEWSASQRLGMVVSGSLTEGMEVRLDADTSIEDIKVGTFVNIQGRTMRFFGVVTDVALASMDPALPASPPDVSNPFVARVVSGTAAYGAITVEPMLTLGAGESVAGIDGPQPAKTIPPHFSPVGSATDDDIRVVFGGEDDRHFWIGSPAGYGHSVVPGRGGIGHALQRGVRQEWDGQDLPDTAAAGGDTSEGCGVEPGVRYAQRIRLAGDVGGADRRGEGAEAVVRLQGGGVHSGRAEFAQPGD